MATKTSNHNPVQLLMKQFKALMNLETSLTPEQRSLHQFQLLATVGKKTLVVLKGGANTIGWRWVSAGTNPPDWNYVHPVKMLEILDDMTSSKYDRYLMKTGETIVKKDKDIRALLEVRPKKTTYIIGVTLDGKRDRLYVYKPGVFQSDWKKVKANG